jgi:hypothetical protein
LLVTEADFPDTMMMMMINYEAIIITLMGKKNRIQLPAVSCNSTKLNKLKSGSIYVSE